jgi:hypothetical protein
VGEEDPPVIARNDLTKKEKFIVLRDKVLIDKYTELLPITYHLVLGTQLSVLSPDLFKRRTSFSNHPLSLLLAAAWQANYESRITDILT